MNQFKTLLHTEAMVGPDSLPLCNRDGRRLFLLLAPLVYFSDKYGEVTIPTGFVTDFGSVPRIPVVFDLLGELDYEPYVIHDALYTTLFDFEREVCDLILVEALVSHGVSTWKAGMIYRGVRRGGESHFRKP